MTQRQYGEFLALTISTVPGSLGVAALIGTIMRPSFAGGLFTTFFLGVAWTIFKIINDVAKTRDD